MVGLYTMGVFWGGFPGSRPPDESVPVIKAYRYAKTHTKKLMERQSPRDTVIGDQCKINKILHRQSTPEM